MSKKNNKFLSFIKSYPFILACAFIIPTTISLGQHLTSTIIIYHNEYYEGEQLHIDESQFELTGIKKIGKVSQDSSNYSFQGAACYQDKYVVCLDGLEAIHIYDSNNMTLLHSVEGKFNRDWHCNQAFFGYEYYKKSDEYPLFYISMEHKNIHSTIAFRIYSRGGSYHLEQIQELKLTFDKEEDTIYYPNSFYDYESGILYYAGYTESSYLRSETNKLKYYSFYLPSYREEDIELHTSEAIETFLLPSETATQGGFISNGHLYQTFSFGSKTDPLRMPVMRVVDLYNKEIIKEYKNLGEEFGVYEEFEHVALNDKGKMISLGNPFNIYEFQYKAE